MKLIELLEDASLECLGSQDPVYKRADEFEVGAAFVAYHEVEVIGGCSRLWGAVARFTPGKAERPRIITVEDSLLNAEKILGRPRTKYSDVLHFQDTLDEVLERRRKMDPEAFGSVRFNRYWGSDDYSATAYEIRVVRRKNGKAAALCRVNGGWTYWLQQTSEITRVLFEVASGERKCAVTFQHPGMYHTNGVVDLGEVELEPAAGFGEDDLKAALAEFSLPVALDGLSGWRLMELPTKESG